MKHRLFFLLGLPAILSVAGPLSDACGQATRIVAPTTAQVIARATTLIEANRFTEAQKMVEARLKIEKVSADRSNLTETLALSYYQEGMAFIGKDEFRDAISTFNKALPLWHQTSSHIYEGATMNWLGYSLGGSGQTEKAIAAYAKAELFWDDLEKKGEDVSAWKAFVFNYTALAYQHLTRYEPCFRYFEKAAREYEKSKDAEGMGLVLSNRGGLYWALGRYQEGAADLRRSLEVFRANKILWGEGLALRGVATVQEHNGQFEEALASYTRALEIWRVEVPRKPDESSTLNSMGHLFQTWKRYDKAEDYYRQSIALFRTIPGFANEAPSLNNLGILYLDEGKLSLARDALETALNMFSQTHNIEGAEGAEDGLMRVWQELGTPNLAIFHGKQAVNLLQVMRSNAKGLDQISETSFVQSHSRTYETLAAILIQAGRLPEAEQVSRMLKQSETLDFVRRDAAQSGTSETLTLSPLEQDYIARYDKLGNDAVTVGDRIAALEKIPVATRTAEQKTALEQLYRDRVTINGRFEVFRKELVAAFADVTPDLQTVDVAASDAWQKALKRVSADTGKRAALLTTVIAPDAFYIILTTPTARLRFSTPIKNGDLNTLVSRFRSELTDPHLDPQDDAQKLWTVVFCNGELEKALLAANIEVALWSLSGSLRYVPIDALHDGTTYLVARERQNVVMTTTSKDYFEAPEGGRALGLGTSHAFQVHLTEGSGSNAETLSFPALSQVPVEVRGIIHDEADGGTGPLDGQILLDSQFNEAQLLTQMQQGFATVHIATHFRLQPGDAERSFLLLGDGKALPVFDWKAKMPLQNVQLLTLSACETGLGGDAAQEGTKTRATGAEVGSLGEVAQLQGASAVVVSLWSVSDSSTSLLMRDFYAKWRQNPEQGKGEALRDAQRALLGITDIVPATEQRGAPIREGGDGPATFITEPNHPFAHPYYWAPFTLIGNWR